MEFTVSNPVIEVRMAVTPARSIAVSSFDPECVKLRAGPFCSARDRAADYLLSLDADRLLSRFRSEAGLTPKAPTYGGWESRGIAGHTLGHYLSGCAKMYTSTGDTRFRDRVAHVVTELAECQTATGDGYIGAIPNGHATFRQIAAGDIRSSGFDLNGMWVPWYTQHKVLAGLLDAHDLCDNAQALTVARGLADWTLATISALDDATMQRMLDCENGGMNDALTHLYALTGEAKYAAAAMRFNHRRVLGPLSERRNELDGKHANTQIPKLIGAAREAELLTDVPGPGTNLTPPALATAAEYFWDAVTRDHSFVNGGNSLNEHFGPAGKISPQLRDDATAETCNTYNMLKLTRKLHAWTGQARYFDYYERALFNHILASQDPVGQGVVYFLPLRTGMAKTFQPLTDAFTCCVGTGMESHASYADAIYSHTPDTLLVNLFIASDLDWKSAGVTLTQETAFPQQNSTKFTITKTRPTPWTLKIRKPHWATTHLIHINGQSTATTTPATTTPATTTPATTTPGDDGYLAITRTWTPGDTIEVTLGLSLRTEATPDNPNKVAILYGPILLAGDLGNAPPTPENVPALVVDSPDPATWATKGHEPGLSFRSTTAIRPNPLRLVPFYSIARQHYVVYFDKMTAPDYAAYQHRIATEESQRRQLEAITVDFVQPGEMQPERDHDFAGEHTDTGSRTDRKWRTAHSAGFIAFTLKLPDTGNSRLVVTCHGSDGPHSSFDLFADETLLAKQTLLATAPGEFIDLTYDLPAQLIAGKKTLRITFRPHPHKVAGPVFGIRTVRAK